MITISCPIKQDYVISLLDGLTIEGVCFTFKEKSGINLKFEIDTDDREKAIKIAKQTIKATEIGSVLYFQVV